MCRGPSRKEIKIGKNNKKLEGTGLANKDNKILNKKKGSEGKKKKKGGP